MNNIETAREYLLLEPMLHADMLVVLQRGTAAVEAASDKGVLLSLPGDDGLLLSAAGEKEAFAMLDAAPPCIDLALHQPGLADAVRTRYGFTGSFVCHQAVYEKEELLPEAQGIDIQKLGPEYLATVCTHYKHADEVYIRHRLQEGMYGAFMGGKLAGFIGVHAEGALGMLEVLPAFRRRGVGYALCAWLTNHFVRQGQTPYAQIHPDNRASLRLQEKLGYSVSQTPCICWLQRPRAG